MYDWIIPIKMGKHFTLYLAIMPLCTNTYFDHINFPHYTQHHAKQPLTTVSIHVNTSGACTCTRELLAWRAGPLYGFLPQPTTPISPGYANTRYCQFLLIWQVERLQLYSKCLHHPDCRPFWASMSHVEIFTLSTTTLSYRLWKEPGCKGEQETSGQRVQLLQTPETGTTSHCWSA